MLITVLFKKDRETKGAVKYQEIREDGSVPTMQEGVIGALYLRKDKLGGVFPEALTVTVEG